MSPKTRNFFTLCRTLARALDAGALTELRVPIQPQPEPVGLCVHPGLVAGRVWTLWTAPEGVLPRASSTDRQFIAPYEVGDRLWVKEPWTWLAPGPWPVYAANYGMEDDQPTDWRSALRMPYRLHRLDIEVTAIRVERLHAITEDSARASGMQHYADEVKGMFGGVKRSAGTALDRFPEVWDRQHGQDETARWSANPYVWVYTVSKVDNG